LAKKTQKTRQCPHCEARINCEKTKVVASAKTSQEASKLIRALKQKKETSENSDFNHGLFQPNSKSFHENL
jgi:hypothetical protein